MSYICSLCGLNVFDAYSKKRDLNATWTRQLVPAARSCDQGIQHRSIVCLELRCFPPHSTPPVPCTTFFFKALKQALLFLIMYALHAYTCTPFAFRYARTPSQVCTCASAQIQRYKSRVCARANTHTHTHTHTHTLAQPRLHKFVCVSVTGTRKKQQQCSCIEAYTQLRRSVEYYV